jgi:glycerol-3-phosphate dehydrogenase
MLTVTGGKLTTFRLMARDALEALGDILPRRPDADRILDEVDVTLAGVDEETRARLVGRHGAQAPNVVAAGPDALTPIDGTVATWGDLRWAARAEGVVHLEDLLLRRVRLGILIGERTFDVMDRIRAIAQPELGWDDATWEREEAAYRAVWTKCYPTPK